MEQILLGSILSISVADDLKFKKVHNVLILGFLFCSLLFLALQSSFQSWQLESLGIGALCLLPLVYFRVLGAGDLKLFFVLALFFEPKVFVNLMILSLAWNAVAGVLKFSVNLITKDQSHKDSLKFPFTFGILLAWLSLAYVPGGLF